MPTSAPTNVYQYWMEQMKTPLPAVDREFEDVDLITHCGLRCMKIIDTANAMLAVCDPNEKIVLGIKAVALLAVEIECFG
jgi:hypothetical protein